jgi:hypothetical protein
MSIPEIKIIIDTSTSFFSGTDNEVKIIFRKYICSGKRESPDFKIDIIEIPLILNKKGTVINTGSSNVYKLKDSRFKDISYVKQFTLEKGFNFYGKIFRGKYVPIPIGIRYSNDWKIKRIRVYYNNTLALDNNPTNSEAKSVWLDKNNYWITYPNPNDAGPNDCGVCGCENYQAPRNFGFVPQGVL